MMLSGWTEDLTRRWRRLRFRLWAWSSPLKLRYSLMILSKISRHPYLRLIGLYLRVPRHFPCHLPPPPSRIAAYDPEVYMDEHHLDIFELRLLPIWRWRDTMQRSFYRLYEAFSAYDEPLVGYETEYFWKRQPGWDPGLIRDPREDGCTDPEELAVLASLAEALVDSFNWRLSLGLRRDGRHVEEEGDDDGGPADYVAYHNPVWTESAPVLPERLILHKYSDPHDASSHPLFDKRNIKATTAALRTV
ncbi:hypothetical protein ACO1O0_007916 [Amphichorda felina]